MSDWTQPLQEISKEVVGRSLKGMQENTFYIACLMIKESRERIAELEKELKKYDPEICKA